MSKSIESINRRVSTRSYSEQPIPEASLSQLLEYIGSFSSGPFGSRLRFVFIDESASQASERKKLGTYGMISGDRYYIGGAVEKGPYAELDYGYCLERIILKATELGLGTCWLGGTLNRGSFADKIKLRDNEIVPAVTPIGIPAELKRLTVRLAQNLMQVRKRREFGSIFYDGLAGRPLSKEGGGLWTAALEAVQAGPSASNKQPWRVIKADSSFHFCLDYDPLYNRAFKDFAIQKVDMGIALCHFELSAKELGLSGTWQRLEPAPDSSKLLYMMSWHCGA